MNKTLTTRQNNLTSAPSTTNGYWGTFDLGISSCLVTLGFELEELKKDNPRKVQFVFKRTDEIEQTVNDYWSDNLKLNPRTLLDNLKMLKNRLYSSDV